MHESEDAVQPASREDQAALVEPAGNGGVRPSTDGLPGVPFATAVDGIAGGEDTAPPAPGEKPSPALDAASWGFVELSVDVG